jgi:hypothetical protein
MEKSLGGLSAVRFGAEYNHSNEKADYDAVTAPVFTESVKEDLVAGFAETDIYLTNRLAAKVGGRIERSSLLNKVNLAPRISLAYQLGKESQASFAYGVFYQNPERRFLPSVSDLQFTTATHYIAQFQKQMPNLVLRAEIFYKKYDNLIKTEIHGGQEKAVSNSGHGYAKGFELFYRDKKSFRNFDYWISYSYLDTKRDFLNYPVSLQPAFASKHTANLVVKKFVSFLKTQFNANYVFASGRPYYHIRPKPGSDKTMIADEGRTIPYQSLSLSMNYLPNIFKKGAGKYTVFVFSVTNVLNSKQVFGYRYSYNGLRKEAIMPPARSFVYIGAFISFGVDRSQDAINSNL